MNHSFANAIQRLLSSAHLRKQQGENARRFVQENFRLDRIRRRYEDLYLGLLEKKCGRKFRQCSAGGNPQPSKT